MNGALWTVKIESHVLSRGALDRELVRKINRDLLL